MKLPNALNQSGNVLFLILIAVALFAALSYVVTQSTRTGGGSPEGEKNTLESAQIIQYPVSIRTSLTRMILGRVSVEQLAFNYPGDFTGVSTEQLVFHPEGGAANYQEAPGTLMVSKKPKNWNFNADFQIPGIGIDGDGGNDLIAFLVGVNAGACQKLNLKLGINLSDCTAGELSSGIPITGSDLTNIHHNIEGGDTFPTGTMEVLDGNCTEAFVRQPSGCFADAGSTPPTYIFYSVVIER